MISVRYDEIALKSRFVRNRFEKILTGNMDRVLRRDFDGNFRIRRGYGRIYIDSASHSESFSEEELRIARRISKVFGVVSADVSVKMELDLEENARRIAEIFENVKGRTFAVRVKRTGRHSFTSMDAARIIGREVVKKGGMVDLKNPEVEISVEIRDSDLYLITDSFRGFRGLPVGTQERVLCILSDEKSLLSSWYALKRGCDIDVLMNPEFYWMLDVLSYWASYREIRSFESDGTFDEMLENAYESGYKAIFCSISSDELDSYSELLRKRKMPVFMPLLPFSGDEIEKKLLLIKGEVDG
jgi:thiamine biosynthesis protein ThiI